MKALSAWLFESREHVEVFFEVCAAWDQLSVLAELSEVFPLEKYRAPSPSPRRTGSWPGRAALAGFVMAIVAAVAFTFGWGDRDFADWLRPGGLVDGATYKTDIGQRSTVTLPDGSEIVLNTNTLIEVRYSGVERRIVLEQGEALFTVTHDSQRPFRVVAGSHVVEAIGTAFTVQKTVDDSLEVMVKEGVVGVRSLMEAVAGVRPDAPVREPERISLAAGEVIVTDGGDSAPIEKQQLPLEEIESRLSWQYGMLFFHDDPLEQVIREVNRYTTTVIVTDTEVGGIRVDGSFRIGDIDALLLAMQENFGLDVMTLGSGEIYLSRATEN